jgi:hypothetical protein
VTLHVRERARLVEDHAWGAEVRFNHDGWTLEQALAEMDQYEFGSGYGHGKQRDFVKAAPPVRNLTFD